jgi:hypothetical protein
MKLVKSEPVLLYLTTTPNRRADGVGLGRKATAIKKEKSAAQLLPAN